MSDAATKPKFVYVTYIRTTPEKLWAALTDPQTIKKYWFGITAESDWKPGSSWRLVFEDGRVADAGEILEAVPGKRLVIRWRNEFKPELKAEGYSRCTMEIETADYYPDRRRQGGEAHDPPRARRRRHPVRRSGLRRLAEDHVQPQVAARNRRRRIRDVAEIAATAGWR